VFDKNFSLLIFVIKNLHGIRALSLSESGQCDFFSKVEEGKRCDCFP
jgi:hypothetical protein